MKVIDLSVDLYTGMKVFQGDPEVKIEIVNTYEEDTWELRSLNMGTHTGTHVDAFSHMHKGKESLDDIPIERFFGQAQVVDVSKEWSKEIGLFFLEDVGLNILERILQSNPRFVGGNISEDLERALLENKIITYTGLINLDLIPRGKSFMFYGLPLKIKGGDGSPVRAIGIVEKL